MRMARRYSETEIYHVMTRGINKEQIFEKQNHKLKFNDILKSILDEGNVEIIAYCIMDNHVHMLIKAEKESFVMFMKKLNVRYAMYYNKIERRNGHLFQDRYRSEVVEDDDYYLGVIRYIHNNPVKAGMVETAQEYKWSSMNDYINKVNKFINKNIMENVLFTFNNTDDFIKFHTLEDEQIYIDLKDDEEKIRDRLIYNIIDRFYDEEKLNSYDKIDLDQKKKLIKKLFNIKGLTNLKIAEICESPVYLVNNLRNEINSNS